jgi:hypothetical protein
MFPSVKWISAGGITAGYWDTTLTGVCAAAENAVNKVISIVSGARIMMLLFIYKYKKKKEMAQNLIPRLSLFSFRAGRRDRRGYFPGTVTGLI